MRFMSGLQAQKTAIVDFCVLQTLVVSRRNSMLFDAAFNRLGVSRGAEVARKTWLGYCGYVRRRCGRSVAKQTPTGGAPPL